MKNKFLNPFNKPNKNMKITQLITIFLACLSMISCPIKPTYGQSVQAELSEVGKLTPEEQLLVLQTRTKKPTSVASQRLREASDFSTEFAQSLEAFISSFDKSAEITIERLNEFITTPAGKIVVGFIGWKILAEDIIKVTGNLYSRLIGWILLIPFCIFFSKGWNLLFVGRYVKGKELNDDGKTYRKVTKWTEPIRKNKLGEEYATLTFIFIAAAVIFGITVIVLIS